MHEENFDWLASYINRRLTLNLPTNPAKKLIFYDDV